ncbi:ATP-binding cassette sub-family A member 2 [Microplitis demolitor]|uniref:ATP-binding cassette sub-family A member 2 n=1 Tax=Microplitis demolitor TaxID=69319 RepID=UPI0004CCCABF|nr:ATP-binding cassette sub-family A member 2 [Microplitis demolitor]
MSYYQQQNQTTEIEDVMWVIFLSNVESAPTVLDYEIRSELFEEHEDTDPYLSSGFLAMQVAIESTFNQITTSNNLPFTGEDLVIGQFPYYRIEFPIIPSAVRPNISLIFYMTVIGFILIPMSALTKAIHDKFTGFKASMRLLKINSAFLYLGWVDYIMITGVPAVIFSTWILDAIYSQSSIVLAIFLLMYITMSTFFILAVGTFFTQSIKAVLACILLWLTMAHVTIILDESLINAKLYIKTFSLLLPHSGLLYGLAAFTYKEDIGQKVHTIKSRLFDNLHDLEKPGQVSNKISITAVLIAWTFHLILWGFIAVYLDNIHPGKFGTKLPWYYLCKQKNGSPDDINFAVRGSTNWSSVERPPQFVKPKVRVRKITIEFGFERLQVLKDLSIDFYPNEFSVILGHNGSGKSSLLKIIAGMYQATYGSVYIEGRDYSDSKSQERNYKPIIGYCPQENMLVKYLSTQEHLYLFGMMKGMSFSGSKEESRRMIKLFGLEAEKTLKVKEISFGAKRRLCLAIALIGHSEILILDEPTYGVDPQHRKRLWELLGTFKGRKTIIVATNSMEAADTLADRIAIIANGRIECYGSKAYLNKRYNIGYDLSMVIKPDCDLKSLQKLIQEHSPEPVSLMGKMGMMVNFNVSRNTRFAHLLSFLESYKDDLRINAVSMQPATIEGQFRRIGLVSHFRERGAWFPSDKFEWIVQQRRRKLIQAKKKWTRITDGALRRQQLFAMVYKKTLHVIASWNPYLFSIIFSTIALILTMVVSGLSKFPHIHSPEIKLNTENYTLQNFYPLVYVDDDESAQNFFKSFDSTCQKFNMNPIHVTKNMTALDLMIHPELHSISFRERYFMAMDILKDNKIELLYSPVLVHSGPISLNLLHNALLLHNSESQDTQINLTSRPIMDPDNWQYRISHGKGVKNWENAVIITTLFILLPTIDLGVRESRTIAKLLQLNTNRVSTFVYWLPTYFIDISIYLISLLITSLVSFSAYRHAIVVSPTVMAQVFLIFLCYGAAAISMVYCIQLWTNQTGRVYFFILMINLLTAIVINPEMLFPLIMHNINRNVQKYAEIIFHIFPPYVFSCAIGNFIAIKLYNNECAEDNDCENEFAMEDPCCYNCGSQLCYKPLNEWLESRTDPLFQHSVVNDVIILISQAACFYLILIICEPTNRRKWYTNNYCRKNTISKDEDLIKEQKIIDDMIEEYERNGFVIPENAVIVKGLAAKYGKTETVHDINFRINKRECFGILGMNGAGKTTIFRALVGETVANIEKAVIYGVDSALDDDQFYGMVGYCPQKGGLIDFLTGRQSLYFFAALRGVPWKNIREEVDKWLDVFDMLEFENIPLKNCAWGVRRKICVLQSIIGDLPVLFLDEPSSGMDIIGRSALDETLYQLREMGRCIFMTTHSIDEAEALCDRVGILSDGYLVTVGSCERLVQRQGNKFIMRVILDPQTSLYTVDFIIKSIEDALSSSVFLGRHLDVLSYEFEKTDELEDVYSVLNAVKLKHPEITEYFINQQSLEQVYHHLSKIIEHEETEPLTRVQKFFDAIRRIERRSTVTSI